jgi:hypothetical protein
MASSEIFLIAAGAGLLAYYGPKFDLLVIVCVVLLARFRGRVQALTAATNSASSGWVLSQPDIDSLKISRGAASSRQ